MRALEQRGAILVDGRGLRLVLGFKCLGFLAQRFRLGELVADEGNLAVERLADRARDLLPDQNRKYSEHSQRDPTARVEAEKNWFARVRCGRVADHCL